MLNNIANVDFFFITKRHGTNDFQNKQKKIQITVKAYFSHRHMNMIQGSWKKRGNLHIIGRAHFYTHTSNNSPPIQNSEDCARILEVIAHPKGDENTDRNHFLNFLSPHKAQTRSLVAKYFSNQLLF